MVTEIDCLFGQNYVEDVGWEVDTLWSVDYRLHSYVQFVASLNDYINKALNALLA